MKERIVVALGGNAILSAGQRGTAEEQRENIYIACQAIAGLICAGHEVVVTHGNGPQVGAVLLQNALAAEVTPAMPLDVCGAATQGQLGYAIQQTLSNILRERGLPKLVVSLVTQVEVSAEDPAFGNPTKPIGSFYSQAQAEEFTRERGWVMKEDKARGGWRRVVPSPDPISIVEKEAVSGLLHVGAVVIASGGGGVPVVSVHGIRRGLEAVIDKDLAGQRLAQDVGASTFMILTDVPNVAIHFGTPQQINLGKLSLAEAEQYRAEGHFAAGSMGPKVHAAIRFVQQGGGRAIITCLAEAEHAAEGKAGTVITL